MLKTKKNSFFIELNELDLDLKKIVKFNINTQSLEISSFLENENNKLNIFYKENKVVILHKGKLLEFSNPDIYENNSESYKGQHDKLLRKYKEKLVSDKNFKDNVNTLGYRDKVKEYMNVSFYSLSCDEKKEFENLVEKELSYKDIDIDTKLIISEKGKSLHFNLCKYSLKKQTEIYKFYGIIDQSRLTYGTDEFVANGYSEINISSFISYHNEISIKLKNIIRKFIEYRVIKSMPKKYFNL
jgi:hypothetical protein